MFRFIYEIIPSNKKGHYIHPPFRKLRPKVKVSYGTRTRKLIHTSVYVQEMYV